MKNSLKRTMNPLIFQEKDAQVNDDSIGVKAVQVRLRSAALLEKGVQLGMHYEYTQCGKTKNLLSPKSISSNQLCKNFFSKNVAFTNFCQKRVRVNFCNFHNVDQGVGLTHS